MTQSCDATGSAHDVGCVCQEWIQQNHILSIVLRDSLHQPQYVEKLEKILRFVIKEKALTLQDLDSIWAAQVSVQSPDYKLTGHAAVNAAKTFPGGLLSRSEHFSVCFILIQLDCFQIEERGRVGVATDLLCRVFSGWKT